MQTDRNAPLQVGAGALCGALVSAAAFAAPAYAEPGPKVIELTQTSCQFVESENGVDHGFRSKSKTDCERTNRETASSRLSKAGVLRLKPGKYVFRVTNRNVPYALGFYLREHDYNRFNPLHKLTKTAVSGGGLHLGVTRDYPVELKPGEYVYSCPLNPTPDYRLVVAE